jgi:hypothetical protein
LHADKTISPLNVTLRPSRLLLRVNAITHLLASVAVQITPLVWAIQSAMVGLIAVSFVFYHRQHSRENRSISYNAASGWQVMQNGIAKALLVETSTVVTPLATFLHAKHAPAILIVHDALDENDYRQLVVKLKITANVRQ